MKGFENGFGFGLGVFEIFFLHMIYLFAKIATLIEIVILI